MNIKFTFSKILGFVLSGICSLIAVFLFFITMGSTNSPDGIAIVCLLVLLAFVFSTLPVLILEGKESWENFLKELIFKD